MYVKYIGEGRLGRTGSIRCTSVGEVINITMPGMLVSMGVYVCVCI